MINLTVDDIDTREDLFIDKLGSIEPLEKAGIEVKTVTVAENPSEDQCIKLLKLFEDIIFKSARKKIIINEAESSQKLLKLVGCFYFHALNLKTRKAVNRLKKIVSNFKIEDCSIDYIDVFSKSDFLSRN